MFKRTVLLLCGLAAISLSAQIKELTFYEVKQAKTAPVIDGKLDDAAWKEADIHNSYYVFWNQNPPLSKDKTETCLLYDSRGIYIGIVNHEKNIDKLRKLITVQGDNNAWTDDCAEIYVDRWASGIEYRRFVVTCTGIMADTMRLDEANMRDEWDADGWSAKTSINKDEWVAEVFIPWSDLGRKGEPGQLWSFQHNRFNYTTGGGLNNFSCFAPGGNTTNTNRFGYLYFVDDNMKLNYDDIASLINQHAAPPWGLSVDNGLLQNVAGKISFTKLDKLLLETQASFEGKITECEKATRGNKELEKSFDKIKAKYEKLKEEDGKSLAYILQLMGMTPEIEDILWKTELENNL